MAVPGYIVLINHRPSQGVTHAREGQTEQSLTWYLECKCETPGGTTVVTGSTRRTRVLRRACAFC